MNKKYIFLLSGKKQVGKNTTADILIEKLKTKRLNVEQDLFANDLKYGCVKDFQKLKEALQTIRNKIKFYENNLVSNLKKEQQNFNARIFEDIEDLTILLDREITLEEKNFFEDKTEISRAILQLYGTEIFRDRVDKDYWAKQVRNRTIESEAEAIVVTDTRFPNEISVFNDIDDDRIVPVTIRIERNTGFGDCHESETALDDYKEWNYIIDNNGTLDDLNDAVGVVVDDIFNNNNIPFNVWIKNQNDIIKEKEEKEEYGKELMKKYCPELYEKLETVSKFIGVKPKDIGDVDSTLSGVYEKYVFCCEDRGVEPINKDKFGDYIYNKLLGIIIGLKNNIGINIGTLIDIAPNQIIGYTTNNEHKFNIFFGVNKYQVKEIKKQFEKNKNK